MAAFLGSNDDGANTFPTPFQRRCIESTIELAKGEHVDGMEGYNENALFCLNQTVRSLQSLREISLEKSKSACDDKSEVTERDFSLQSVVEHGLNQIKKLGFKKELDPSLFILKVTGFNDYILSPIRKLIDYQYVRHCLRNKILPELSMLTLKHDQKDEIADALQKENLAAEKRRRQELDFDEKYDEEKQGSHNFSNHFESANQSEGKFSILDTPLTLGSPVNGGSKKDSCRSLHNEKTFIPLEDVVWPFRVKVLGVDSMAQEKDLFFPQIICQAALYLNGELLPPKLNDKQMILPKEILSKDLILQTEPTLYCQVPRWRGNWLKWENHVIRNLHIGATIGFMLMGYDPKTRKKTPIAGVSIPLFDYEGQLRTGNQAYRLWPHPSLQLARDPHADKHGGFVRPLSMELSPAGEDHSPNFAGVLHVEFDTFLQPVRHHQVSLHSIRNEVEADFQDEVIDALENERMSLDSEHDKDAAPPVPVRWGSISGSTRMSRVNSNRQCGDDKSAVNKSKDPTEDEEARLRQLMKSNCLEVLSSEDKELIWRTRRWCSRYSVLLPRFLKSVHWGSPVATRIARHLTLKWERPVEPIEWLELLDVQNGDPVIRTYILTGLNEMTDIDLAEHLLQLVQALKFELYHSSSLAKFLIYRALGSPLRIGHRLFWLLRSEIHNHEVRERFGIILDAYLSFCGSHKALLRRQLLVDDLLHRVAVDTANTKSAKRLEFCRDELTKVNGQLPSKFQLCLSPRFECKKLKIEKCKVMSSKKLPLWLVFENADPQGEDLYIIYKSGDDLRQDEMTLQMIRIMDKIWLRNGLDMRMKPYGCCSSGDEIGMIEVVTKSNTTANIQQEYGGAFAGAYNNDVIIEFLNKHNKLPDQEKNAVENFMRSCAGYCVATYVLGIGDRHADNIMVTQNGHLFHIDFGHFLGNFKSKYGIKRERVPFVFTPDMANVFGGKDDERFKQFEQWCCEAYNILRKHANLFLDLFVLMIPAGVPELVEKADITYLLKQLSLEMEDDKAQQKFKQEIQGSLANRFRRFDNMVHNIKHR